jgi:hypothetical protein
MAKTDYGKYLVRKPVFEMGKKAQIKGRQIPTMTYMSKDLVPECNTYVEYGWIYDMPEPNPHIREHAHEHDEIVMHIGSDPDNPEDLGGEIEFIVGGQPLTFDTSMALYIPAGVKHGPLTWKKVTRPHIQMSITLGKGSYGYRNQEKKKAE